MSDRNEKRLIETLKALAYILVGMTIVILIG